MAIRCLRVRKFSPIDREYPIYEVLDDDVLLFDVSRTDEGEYELAFHASCNGRVVQLEAVTTAVLEAKALLRDID